MGDNFIRLYIGELLRSLRTQYLIDLIKPYTRLELSFLAKVIFPLFRAHRFQNQLNVLPSATERRHKRGRRTPHRTNLGREGGRPDRPSRDEVGT